MNRDHVPHVSVGAPFSTPLAAVDGPSPSGQGHDVAQVGETLVGAVPQTAMTLTIPLGQLRVDTRLQPRRGGLVRDNLERLLSSDPGTWPPLLVRPVGRGYSPAVGWLRPSRRMASRPWLIASLQPKLGQQ